MYIYDIYIYIHRYGKNGAHSLAKSDLRYNSLLWVGWLGRSPKDKLGAPTGSNGIISWNSRDPNMESAGPLPQ